LANILIFIVFLLENKLLIDAHASRYASEKTSCRTSPQTSLTLEPARGNTSYQNITPQDSFFTLLQQESVQKVETLQKDPGFQEILVELQNSASKSPNACRVLSKEEGMDFPWVPTTAGKMTEEDLRPSLDKASLSEINLHEASLYIFISFSMGEKALLNLAHEAKQFGATLVLRGFHEGSYVKTAQALNKIILETGQGVIIDPELYSLFDITAVPTFVLAKPFNLIAVERVQTPLHDKLQGHVSPHYALETFSKMGDLKEEAQDLLKRGTHP